MRSKIRGLVPSIAFTLVMLFLVGVGISVIASGHHYEGVSIITFGGWTWLAWAAGYGMHAWKKHSEIVTEIRDSLRQMKDQLSGEQPGPAVPSLRVVRPGR